MGIATDILGLRNHQFSSVIELLAAIEQVHDAPLEKMSFRVFLVGETADKVLTNVAAHAAEALNQQHPIRNSRRVASASRRKNRRYDSRPLPRQRTLFAA